MENLLDSGIQNESGAFHREFALVRGPINTVFLAYKADVVGILPRNDLSLVRLGEEHRHLVEVVENLKIFTAIGY